MKHPFIISSDLFIKVFNDNVNHPIVISKRGKTKRKPFPSVGDVRYYQSGMYLKQFVFDGSNWVRVLMDE